ncbi:Uncharacterised protein [Serratia proteamaculans]|nr:Uncharacterised protein [Serratia proteamaculans]
MYLMNAGAEARLRIALLNVDYVTSFELLFRLLLIRTPQLIADRHSSRRAAAQPERYAFQREALWLHLEPAKYLSAIPDAFQYRIVTRIRRVDPTGVTTAPYQHIAKEVKALRERLRLALESRLQVTVLDGLF